MSARKMEILLATLLIRAGQLMSADQLLTELWGEDPPRRADAGLYVYISQLRKFLGSITESNSTIVTKSPGYVLHLGSDELDLHAFQNSARLGREQLKSGTAGEAAKTLESALALIRGSVLGGLQGGPVTTSFATWFEEARLECLEMQMEAHLALDRHREVVSPLYSLIAEHPLREAFYQFLMIALYRSGRQADAIRVYKRARDIIVDELGLEPCRSLRDLHQAILVADGDVDVRIAV
ncbi:AfsR/SARP family transcriptional regulator [Streptomyces sp. NRRL F-5123]|uniref:AfsR/SARP family transcriptional regulator n=1 Tax=Streptomyces sp. NRRL F-5123 TaxID=1463856 RepID=UPI002D219418|nr:AfsR/SARP family transcriptional regulator [Streptomyces sp. NRRL F-5123]